MRKYRVACFSASSNKSCGVLQFKCDWTFWFASQQDPNWKYTSTSLGSSTLAIKLSQMDVQVTLSGVVAYIKSHVMPRPRLQHWNKPTNKITLSTDDQTTKWHKFLLLPDTTPAPPPLLLLHSSRHSSRWWWLLTHNYSWKPSHLFNPGRNVVVRTWRGGGQSSPRDG